MINTANRSSLVTDPTVLIIGYGNPNKGDDAIGQAVVSQLKALKIPTVESCSVTQLTPELASKLAAANFAIFVDACKLGETAQVRIKSLYAYGSEPAGSVVPAFGHSCDPCSLLALTHSAYGHCPQAWWIEVPASDFTAGRTLSELAERGVAQALHEIEELITSLGRTQSL